jgi:hypothetical protein
MSWTPFGYLHPGYPRNRPSVADTNGEERREDESEEQHFGRIQEEARLKALQEVAAETWETWMESVRRDP